MSVLVIGPGSVKEGAVRTRFFESCSSCLMCVVYRDGSSKGAGSKDDVCPNYNGRTRAMYCTKDEMG